MLPDAFSKEIITLLRASGKMRMNCTFHKVLKLHYNLMILCSIIIMQFWDTEYLWQIITWRNEIKIRCFSSKQGENHFLIICLTAMITPVLLWLKLHESSSGKIYRITWKKSMFSKCHILAFLQLMFISAHLHSSSKLSEVHSKS